MSVLTGLLPENPVLVKEMRVRMRGARAYWILLGYLGFLSLVLLFTYQGWEHDVAMTGAGASESAETGKSIYTTLLICQVFLVLFITPAITSGSITIEKEQQTLDMLTMTRLSRGGMVAGKLISAVSFTSLLLISSLPLVSICFMLGGIDPAMVFSTYMAMLFGSFLIGAIGLTWSAIAKTTTVAVLLTYLSMLAFAVVMAIAITAYTSLRSSPTALTYSQSEAIGVFAFAAIVFSWCGASFMGFHGFEYIGFALLCLVAGILLAAISMSRLETWPEKRAGLLRGLTTLLVLLQVGACYIWWLDRIYVARGLGAANAPALGALAIPMLALMLLVPIFATGEISAAESRRFGGYLVSGWLPKGLVRGNLASGIPFLALLTLLCVAAYMLSFVRIGKAGDILHSAALPGPTSAAVVAVQPPVSVPGGYTGVIRSGGNTTVYNKGVIVSINGQPVTPPTAKPAPPPTATVRTGFWDSAGDFPQAVILMLTTVIGFALVCQFLSVAFSNRWVAMALSYAIVFAVLVLPWLSAGMADSGSGWLTINVAYLNPLLAFAEMTESQHGAIGAWWAQHLVFGGLPIWLATSALWTVIGALAFTATLPLVARRAMKSKAIPYEEMAVSG